MYIGEELRRGIIIPEPIVIPATPAPDPTPSAPIPAPERTPTDVPV